MSYAIIRNEKYLKSNLAGIYRHNERKNTNYSNKDIKREKSIHNYSIKKPYSTYDKIFQDIREKYNLKGQIKKVSNIVCEYIITASPEFFKEIGEEETKRYFETAYKFVANYKNLGEEYIISAKVHMDESNPHMHLIYIPVVHTIDKKSGKAIDKISCSEFWKGKDSYGKLQDNFYNYITKNGFDLERGQTRDNKHIEIKKLKTITNYEMQELFKDSAKLEKEIDTNDINELRTDYKRIIKKFNTLAKQYTRVKTVTDNIVIKQEELQNENTRLNKENYELQIENDNLQNENTHLKNFLEKTFDYVSILFNFPKDRLKRLVKGFVDKMKGG